MMINSEKGVGLVEIIIAILIFGVGISAALRTLPDSNRASSRAKNLTTATNLAQEKIEELMGEQFNSAELTAGTHNDPQNPLDRHYNRAWTVVDNSPVVNMKTVTVTVTYEGASKDNSATLTTYLTSRR